MPLNQIGSEEQSQVNMHLWVKMPVWGHRQNPSGVATLLIRTASRLTEMAQLLFDRGK